MEKKREYGDRVRSMEHGSFTPLVFSTFSGLGREATVFYSSLIQLGTDPVLNQGWWLADFISIADVSEYV